MSSSPVRRERGTRIQPYTRFDLEEVDEAMARRSANKETEPFGRRMARLRKLAGYSQRTLAQELGVSYRMVAYYEAQTERIPAHLLPALAEALGITVDQVLGREAVTPRKSPENRRLLRKLRKVEKLPPRARNAVIEHIDALLTKHSAGS